MSQFKNSIIIKQLSWLPYNCFIFINKKNVSSKLKIDLSKIGIKRNFELNIHNQDKGLATHLLAFGFREPIHFRYYYNFISRNDVVLDIGANIGLFTLLSENAKKIISIEPQTDLIPILRKNIKENNLLQKVKIINKAVGKSNSELILLIAESMNLSRIVTKEFYNENPQLKYNIIDTYSLPQLTERFKINSVRLDVEGYEFEILYNQIPKSIEKIDIELHVELLGEKKVIQLLKYFEKENFLISFLIEDLPLRLYPFFNYLTKTNLLSKFIYIKKNINPIESKKYLMNGRNIKYLLLTRKKNKC